MTARKPPGVSWDSWIEQKIRDAQDEGLFNNLPGAGRPIDGLTDPRDDDWWIKEKLRREELSYLPPTLAIRKDVEDAHAAIATAPTEADVRAILGDLNARIRHINSRGASGPPSSVMPLDTERLVTAWHAARSTTPDHTEAPANPSTNPAAPRPDAVLWQLDLAGETQLPQNTPHPANRPSTTDRPGTIRRRWWRFAKNRRRPDRP